MVSPEGLVPSEGGSLCYFNFVWKLAYKHNDNKFKKIEIYMFSLNIEITPPPFFLYIFVG